MDDEKDRKGVGRILNLQRLQTLTILDLRLHQQLPEHLVSGSHKIKEESDQVEDVLQTLNQPLDNSVQVLAIIDRLCSFTLKKHKIKYT